MKSSWPDKTIDELKAKSKSAISMGPFGSRIKVENFVSKGVPVLKGGNLHEAVINDENCDFLTEEKASELSTSAAVSGDIVITHRGTIGQVSIIPENSRYSKYIVSQSQLKVSLNRDIVNPVFVNYYLRSPEGQHQLLSFSSQVGVPAIAKASTSVKQILMPCPPLNIQHNVVSVLSGLDDKIRLNKKINQTLEQIAQAIFKSWFVDFEPTKAKIVALEAGGNDEDATLVAMTGISGKSVPELEQMCLQSPKDYGELRNIADLFPSELEESELGLMPKGWPIKSLGDILTPKKGKVITKKTITEGSIPVVAGGLSPAYYHDKYNAQAPVITVSASGANAGYVRLYHENIWASDCSYINNTQTSFVYTVYTLLKISQKEIFGMQQGAAQPHIYPSDIMRLILSNPSNKIWEASENILRPVFQKIRENELETLVLKKIRDALLPKLLSGEIDLSAAENLI